MNMKLIKIICCIIPVKSYRKKIRESLIKNNKELHLSVEEKWLSENKMERMDANSKSLFSEYRKQFHLDRYRFASAFIEDKDVLDIACGTGYGSNEMLALGRPGSITGVDIDSGAVNYANNTYSNGGKIEFKQGSILDIPFEDNSFDVLISFETLEHVEDEKAQFSEIKRVLKPGGLYILSTPNQWGLTEFHVRDYDYRVLSKTLCEDFELVQVYNQNSATPGAEFNRNQPRGILKTSESNKNFAECFVAICKNNK